MAMEYFPCYDSYLTKTAKLSDQELGRLFRALMTYHATGEVAQLAGRESVAYDFIRDDIVRATKAYDEKCDRLRENGKKGAIGSKSPQMPPIATNCHQMPPDAPQSKSKYKSKYKSNSKSNIYESADADSPFTQVQEAWNSIPGLPHIDGIPSGSKREKMLRARIDDYGIEKVLGAIELVKSSAFLTGATGWKASFDWFIAPSNFLKVIEGNYQGTANAESREIPKGASGQLGAAELEAIQRVLREG